MKFPFKLETPLVVIEKRNLNNFVVKNKILND